MYELHMYERENPKWHSRVGADTWLRKESNEGAQSKLMYREEELRTLGKMARKSKNYHDDECRLNE